jgi:predicted aspartyl protease
MIRSGTLNDNDFIGSQIYVQADGSKIPSATFIIKSLKVGEVELKNVTGSVSNINGQLLLGQSFLSRVKVGR